MIYTQAEHLDKVKSRLVGVDKGGVLIGRLVPSTLYSVEARALGADGTVLTQTDLLRTLPTGEFFSDCIHHASLHVCPEFFINALKVVLFPVHFAVVTRCTLNCAMRMHECSTQY